MRLPFTKMHGLGNDFAVIDCVSQPLQPNAEQIAALADRHLGIGFDQLLLIEAGSSDQAEFRYRIFNADGSEVEHCGNGARCFAKYVHDKGLTQSNPVLVETVNRVLSLQLSQDGLVSVNMGAPNFDPASLPLQRKEEAQSYKTTVTIAGQDLPIQFSAVSMGNPHAVIFVENCETAEVETIGPALGQHTDFPQGVNVGFLQIVTRNECRLRVYERGSGETLACGTGACAAVAAARSLDLVDSRVRVKLRGGELEIGYPGLGSELTMTGPAVTAYEGSVEL
jgi:diaminopimelate epimerase